MRHILNFRVDRILLFFAAGMLAFSNPAYTEPFLINVMLSAKGGGYQVFSDALRDLLRNQKVTLNILETTQIPPNANLNIAVGMNAAKILARNNELAVLNVMIPESGHKLLLRDFPKRANSPQFSSIYLDQPVERQLSLIAAIFPGRKRVGILFDSPPPDDLVQLRNKSSEYGLSLYEEEVGANSSMFEPLQNVLLHSDILLALPVPTIYNSATLRNILVSTYQAGVPLVGFSAAFVNAGAICAVFTTPAQLASQTNITIQRYIETGILPPSQYPKQYQVAVNDRVAQSLKIIIKTPDEIYKLMNATRKQMP